MSAATAVLNGDVPRRYPCMFDGCDKSFQRKEHLGRHERSHNPQTLCICKVCNRKFNRSDSLLRHLARHGDAFKPNPSGRSKRACTSCHTGKTKCDGNQPCSTCQKKDAECIYRQEGQEQNEPRLQGPSLSPQRMSVVVESSSSMAATPSSSNGTHDSSNVSQMSDRLASVTSSLSLNSSQHGRPIEAAMITMPPPTPNFIDWMNIRIRSDPDTPQSTPGRDLRVESPERRYLDSYFENFHHRWLLIHRPSFEEDNAETPLIAAMRMIGAWLYGTKESRDFAVTTHERLMANIIPRLCAGNAHEPLCLGLCLTSLLNIIFGLYHGKDKGISRVVILRNILVGVLREINFLKAETAWADEKSDYFLPMRLAKMGQRQRLVANLFKVDTYLSLIRCQPNVVMPEELYFTLPGTYSMWNARELRIWEERHLFEPTFRNEKSMSDMITDSTSESQNSTTEYPMLIEDIQLCISAIQSSMWKLFHPAGTPKDCEIDVVLQKDTLRRRLDMLTSKLNRMTSQNLGSFEFGDEPHLPLRYYYGYEDHSVPGWKEIVSARVKSLHFDAIMLSLLFSLHLHADVSMLTQLARDQRLTTTEEESERHTRAREIRQMSVRAWANTSTARQAICYAVDVLVQHQTISREINHTTGLEKNTMDPVAFVAISVAALITWAYCMYSAYSCDGCTHEQVISAPSLHGLHAVELTRLSAPGDQSQQGDRELWVEMGGGTRIQLQGVQVCLCNGGYLAAMFQIHIPPGWEVAHHIAPDILKQ